jgi:hypothetical protein
MVDLIDVEILNDQASLADLADLLGEDGDMLVCHRCLDADEIIAAVLLIREEEEAWALCGSCLRQLPLQGQLAS